MKSTHTKNQIEPEIKIHFSLYKSPVSAIKTCISRKARNYFSRDDPSEAFKKFVFTTENRRRLRLLPGGGRRKWKRGSERGPSLSPPSLALAWGSAGAIVSSSTRMHCYRRKNLSLPSPICEFNFAAGEGRKKGIEIGGGLSFRCFGVNFVRSDLCVGCLYSGTWLE
ncbi:unnamed protein product [Linum tenue]|uniref:Uncharacterized protein n=1 Tax=Linum tenue TaxID=586396 RepID=A0AAV0JBN6_9ROSI|nr:unnamed protein product [Linum tenue]